MKKTNKIRKSSKAVASWGVAASIIAASYYLYGTDKGAKKRHELKGWVIKAKGEVINKLEKLTKVDENTYRRAVEDVFLKYKKLKNIDTKEAQELFNDLKKHWKRIEKKMDKVEKDSKNSEIRKKK